MKAELLEKHTAEVELQVEKYGSPISREFPFSRIGNSVNTYLHYIDFDITVNSQPHGTNIFKKTICKK